MAARPPRKCITDGEGMVIFGVTLVLAFRNLKCSIIGWSAGKSSLPVTFRLSALVCTPWNWMPWSVDTRSQPVRCQKKSKCHQERRNSPSVASCRPTSSCLRMIFLISSSSTALSWAGGDLALLALGARFFQRRGAQQAADLVGAVRGDVTVSWASLLSTIVAISCCDWVGF